MSAFRPASLGGSRAFLQKGSGGSSPLLSDPFFNRVSLLMHGDGIDGATATTDSSSFAHAVTPFGGAHLEDTWKRFGPTSMQFSAIGDHYKVADNNSLDLGGEDFTIEANIYITGLGINQSGSYAATIAGKDKAAGRSYIFYLDGTVSAFTSLRFLGSTNNTTSFVAFANFAFALNTHYHVAVCRIAGFVVFFVDGARIGTSTAFNHFLQTTVYPLEVGAYNFDATYHGQFRGYIDELRISKSHARYATSYVVPSAPFPDF